MYWVDIDGVLDNFKDTAKEYFGIALKHNVFGEWKWCSQQCDYWGICKQRKGCSKRAWVHTCKNPTPIKFYNVVKMQPWAKDLISVLARNGTIQFITADYAKIKKKKVIDIFTMGHSVIEAPDKSVYCKCRTDLLIDDNPNECERWRQKGGIAYWFNLEEENPYLKFLEWWRLGK
ncbi:MAG: hypothetical protein LBC87_07310 [Fibromonadaceae bacterium]|jgi:hypothetical protein|nr:hypothetical protein [Fibromonadaceae bacterium]